MVGLTSDLNMRDEIVATLRCPRCRGSVSVGEDVRCEAGHTFPIVSGVPRLVGDAWTSEDADVVEQTKRAFGDQWNELADDATVTAADLALHVPSGWTVEDTFRGLALDVGCGMGRYTRLATDAGATTVGLDLSRAVDKAAERWPELVFLQGDIAAPPFAERSFDLVYSFGVIHHLPDPERGLSDCWRLVAPGGRLLVWVYAERGGVLRRARRAARAVVARAPALLPSVARSAAAALWVVGHVPGPPRRRLRFYRDKGFRQLYVDCHDALAAPLERYVTGTECRAWLDRLEPGSGGYERRRDGSGWVVWARRTAAA